MSICGRACAAAAEQIVGALRRVRRAAVGERQDLLDVAVHQRAVWLQRVEGAGSSQRLQRALVERLGVAAAGEVGQVLEGPLRGALRDDALDRLRADVLQRRQRIADGASSRLARKSTSDALTHGGRMAMPDFLRLGGEHGELVGVAHVERHRRGQELLAVVRLQIGGVVARRARRPRRGSC